MNNSKLQQMMANREKRQQGIKISGLNLTKAGVDKLMAKLKDEIKLTCERSISGNHIKFHMINENLVIDIAEGYESKKKSIKTYGSISVKIIPNIVGYKQGELPYEATPIYGQQWVGDEEVPEELSEAVHEETVANIRDNFFNDYAEVIDWLLDNAEELAMQLNDIVELKTCKVLQEQQDGSIKELLAFRNYKEYEESCEKIKKEEPTK